MDFGKEIAPKSSYVAMSELTGSLKCTRRDLGEGDYGLETGRDVVLWNLCVKCARYPSLSNAEAKP